MVKQGYKKAIVAVAHRLARILFQMWRHNQEFDLTQLNVVCETMTKQRTYYYRLKNESTAPTIH